MHALDHGSFLRCHKSGALSAGNSQSMESPLCIQPQDLCRGSRRRKGTCGSRWMEATAKLRGAAGQAYPASGLIAGDHRREKPLPVDLCAAHQGIRRGQHDRSRVKDGIPMNVVQLKAMNQGAIGQRGIGTRHLGSVAPDQSTPALAALLGKLDDGFSPGESGTVKRASEGV